MQIEKHIAGLLFEHDCVIVPGFGGFVCNYSSASIHQGKNQFHPPFKKISFNRSLKNNDGLLANQISQSESISYSDAILLISEYTSRLNNDLSVNKRFDFNSIGTFYLREENTIVFEQDETVNYLPESFGLSMFHSPAIRREPLERKIERALKDKKIIPSKEQKETIVIKRIPVVRYAAIAASLLIVASVVFVSLKPDLLQNTGFANLNPFAESSAALYQPGENDLPESDVTKDNLRNLIASNTGNDTLRYLNIMINGSIPVIVSLEEDDHAVVAKTKKVKHSSAGHFHIIGGAFAIPENADKLANRLIKLGYDATVIEKKLHFVSYGNFETKEEARQALEKIRSLQPDAWLLKI